MSDQVKHMSAVPEESRVRVLEMALPSSASPSDMEKGQHHPCSDAQAVASNAGSSYREPPSSTVSNCDLHDRFV
jgi:hypothetical protein